MDDYAGEIKSEIAYPFPGSRTPQLSIAHVMLWTLCSAVYVALVKVIYTSFSQQSGPPTRFESLWWGLIAWQSAYSGAVLSGSLVLVRIRVRFGPPWAEQPGHWLLLVDGSATVVYFLICCLLMSFDLIVLWPLVPVLLYVCSAIAYLFVCRRVSGRLWKMLVIALAVTLGLNGVFEFVFEFKLLALFAQLLVGTGLVGASIDDVYMNSTRDWLHWFGIMSYVVGPIIRIVWMMWFVFA